MRDRVEQENVLQDREHVLCGPVHELCRFRGGGQPHRNLACQQTVGGERNARVETTPSVEIAHVEIAAARIHGITGEERAACREPTAPIRHTFDSRQLLPQDPYPGGDRDLDVKVENRTAGAHPASECEVVLAEGGAPLCPTADGFLSPATRSVQRIPPRRAIVTFTSAWPWRPCPLSSAASP